MSRHQRATHQAVQPPSQQVHGPQLHGGDLRHVDGGAQVQVEQVPQQVPLAGDHVGLFHVGRRPTAHGALTRLGAAQRAGGGGNEG